MTQVSSPPGSRPAPGPLRTDASFLWSISGAYAGLIVLLTLTIGAYFALGWDVQTFIAAGWSLLDLRDPFGLFAQSRAAFYWPFAYPPLHAILVAVFLPLHSLVPAIPESVLARLPVIASDLGLALLLYWKTSEATGERRLARLAAMVWLFNPVTIYQTAVQAHFESEWVLLVLLAYCLAPGPEPLARDTGLRRPILSTICLAGAILVKQVAVLYAVAYWIYLAFSGRWRQAVLSALGSGAIVALVCLPFALRSPDFLYMVTAYVVEMPVQTQSALVWLLLLKDQLVNSHSSSIFLLRYATPVVAILSGLVSLLAIWRRRDLFQTGILVTVIFFLFSSKVMGYYYAILTPFVLLVLLPRGRLRLATGTLVMISWILLSPYYATWAAPENAWLYAALGTVNSAFFVWLGWQVWRQGPAVGLAKQDRPIAPRGGGDSSLLAIVSAMAATIIICTLAQPAHAVDWVTGRQDLSELLAAAVLLLVTLAVVHLQSRLLSRLVGHATGAWPLLAATMYFPLGFLQFYVGRESTRVLEALLKVLS
jgi:Gpi18-like mannosyltransferase